MIKVQPIGSTSLVAFLSSGVEELGTRAALVVIVRLVTACVAFIFFCNICSVVRFCRKMVRVHVKTHGGGSGSEQRAELQSATRWGAGLNMQPDQSVPSSLLQSMAISVQQHT
jgi:hypothetical protein